MSRQNYTFTSESVSEGHPDKVCDRISDAVLAAFLAEAPEARVACEPFATTARVVIGEPISPDRLEPFMTDPKAMMDFLRAETYGLSPKPLSPWDYGFEFEERHKS